MIVVLYLFVGILTFLICARRLGVATLDEDAAPLAIIAVWPMVVGIVLLVGCHRLSLRVWNWYANKPPEEDDV